MSQRRRVRRRPVWPRVLLAAFVAASASLLVGPAQVSPGSPNFDAALNRVVGQGPAGGTLVLGSTRLCDSFDPALSYDTWCQVVQRTYSRNLVAFAGLPGSAGLTVVPDLAQALPTVSSDYSVWTFTLRNGLKWDDGSPLTTSDVRYSLERLFDRERLGVVSTDVLCLLSACSTGLPDYTGPGTGGHLKAVKIIDNRRIRITLTRPYALFGSVLAMPAFAPIEQDRAIELASRGADYSTHPASSGPFVLTVAEDGQSATLVRNKSWNQGLDGIRVPKVKKMTWTVFDKEGDLDAALLRGDVDVRVDRGLGETARSAVTSGDVDLAAVDKVATGVVNYLALVPTATPLERKPCREAVMYALDKNDLAKIRGGTDVVAIVGSMASPALPGGTDGINPYASGGDQTGDLEAARRKLVQCGYPDGFEVRMAYVSLGVGQATYESVQRALSRVGIVVDPVKYDSFTDYFSGGVGSPSTVHDQQIGIVAASWSPEGASPLSYWAPIADGRRIKLRANLNYSELADDQVDHLLDELEGGNPDVGRISRAIDGIVMGTALFLPYGAERLVLYRGPQLTGVYVQQALGGQYDLVNIGRTAASGE